MSHAEYANVVPSLFNVDKQTPNSENGPVGTLRRFADITDIKDRNFRGEGSEIIPTESYCPIPKATEQAIRKYKEYSVLLRRTIKTNYDGLPVNTATELEIQSETLQKAFRKIVVHVYENVHLDASPIKIPFPYCELFFSRQAIQDFVEDDQNSSELRKEMKLLSDFIYSDKQELAKMIEEHGTVIKEKEITATKLWTIFPPNELVVFTQGPLVECYICRNLLFKSNQLSMWVEFTGAGIEFNGKTTGIVHRTFVIPHFHGTVKIADLPLIPKPFVRDWDAIERQMIQRGNAFSQLLIQGCAHQAYKGPAWGNDVVDRTESRPKFELDEKVMVDYEAYLDEYPGFRPNLERQPKENSNDDGVSGPWAQIYSPSISEGSSASGSRRSSLCSRDGDLYGYPTKMGRDFDPLLFFPALIPAFGLRAKKWGWVKIDDLKVIHWSTKAFETLQLEEAKKSLVKSLIEGHHSSKLSSFDDVIQGKGKGLIFLLQGDPGLGKTLTAESLAEHIKRPLYNISGGELGNDVSTVEKKLIDIFKVGWRWKALVLLDEADVLMVKRSSHELARSAIVAVFLRMIEYYEGVLFLTTNRAADFDEAFQNRVHVTIKYPPLDTQKRACIWKSLLATDPNNPNSIVDATWTDSAYDILGQLDVNGRTIKNTIRTAVCHAQSQGVQLGVRHVAQIVQVNVEGGIDVAMSLGKLLESS